MDTQNDDEKIEARTPTADDLIALCREFNNRNAKYVVVGGMAMIQMGYGRTTEDIDLLLDSSAENQEKVISALLTLPEKAAKEIQPNDLNEFTVIRVADEFVVDLMKSACGIEYEEAIKHSTIITLEGVPIPFAKPELLWRMKQTMREKDNLDLFFLKELLQQNT
ncbi:MAG: hypothetical protein FJ218_09190 [Ignavibacteria bacterium]|nr:hypothetical protein [Ignavibacteria bacterium]